MFPSQKVRELLIHQRRIRKKAQQNNESGQLMKLGQTLKCFKLDKNKNEHENHFCKPIKSVILHRQRTATGRQSSQLGRLVSFYQSERSKRLLYTPQEGISRKKSSKIHIQKQKTDFSFSKSSQKQNRRSLFLNISTSSVRQKSKFDSFSTKQKSFSAFPAQTFQCRSSKQLLTERYLEKPTTQENDYDMFLRRAFIPNCKIRYSSKKKVFK